MKPFIILTVLISFQAFGIIKAQMVTLNGENMPLKEVLLKIHNQTGYEFIYNSQMLNKAKPVNVKLKNAKLDWALQSCFKGQNLSYIIDGKAIVVTPKKADAQAPQKHAITGKVTDENGNPLIGVTVLIKGTTQGTTTDVNGKYSLNVKKGDVLQFSYVGFTTKLVNVGTSPTINMTLKPSVSALNQIVVTGTRFSGRTALNSPVPVDVLNVKNITSVEPQVDMNQLLNYSVPAFTANIQTATDGTDEVDPASLRGLGPDQVLVLVNGKRRHPSALININGSFGRGNVGTDLNTIPSAAVSNIQVLRDGASAQYGSDAIAGVINIILNKSVGQFTLNVTSGAYASKGSNGLTGGMDGPMTNVSANYGIALGKQGGFINFTGAFNYRDYYNRMGAYNGEIFNAYNAVEWSAYQQGVSIASLSLSQIKQYAPADVLGQTLYNQVQAATSISQLQTLLKANVTDVELKARNLTRRDFAMHVGQSALRGGKFFYNMSVPVGKSGTAKFYSFGGVSYRNGVAGAFYRLPYQSRTYTPLEINGFLPDICTNITDQSVSVGIKGVTHEWNVDFSNTWGRNIMMYYGTNTMNTSMLSNSPTTFQDGGFSFAQNTTNLDFSRSFGKALAGVDVAYGAEYRLEHYSIIAGNTDSWATYDTTLQVITSAYQTAPTDFFGSSRPGGSEGFPGYQPQNALSKYRSSVAAYGDVQVNFTKGFMIDGAMRFENYSDFGSTFSWKMASLLKLSKSINIRGSFNTGFRAPSLQQLYFNTVQSLFYNGTELQVGTFSNDSRVAKILGIPALKPELSQSVSMGLTANIPGANLKLTIDGYIIWIQNRIVETGLFKATTPELKTLFAQIGAEQAHLFANAIDTKSDGLSFVLDNNIHLGTKASLKNSFAGTLSKTIQVGSIHASKILAASGQTGTYFDRSSRIYLEDAVPHTKLMLSNILKFNRLTVFLRNNYFGKVQNPTTNVTYYQTYMGKVVTDLSLGYNISRHLNLTIGANNLFDVYPDKNSAANQSSGRFIYPRGAIQFGFGGRFVFARLLAHL